MGSRSRYRKKSEYRYPQNFFWSLLALIFFMYILYVVFIIPFMNSLGGFGEIITDLVEVFPFGEVSYAAAIAIINAIIGQGINYASIQGVFTFSYLMQELLEGIFTVIIYEGAKLAMMKATGLDDPDVRGIWNGAKRVVITVGLAILAACFAPAVINFIFSSMATMSIGWKTVISSLVSIILVGGGIGFFLFFYSLTFGTALGYVLLNFLLIGGTRLFISYVCIFVFCIGIHQGVFFMIFGGMSGLVAALLILAALEWMLESVFGID